MLPHLVWPLSNTGLNAVVGLIRRCAFARDFLIIYSDTCMRESHAYIEPLS